MRLVFFFFLPYGIKKHTSTSQATDIRTSRFRTLSVPVQRFAAHKTAHKTILNHNLLSQPRPLKR